MFLPLFFYLPPPIVETNAKCQRKRIVAQCVRWTLMSDNLGWPRPTLCAGAPRDANHCVTSAKEVDVGSINSFGATVSRGRNCAISFFLVCLVAFLFFFFGWRSFKFHSLIHSISDSHTQNEAKSPQTKTLDAFFSSVLMFNGIRLRTRPV
jgi:hypothetical protein